MSLSPGSCKKVVYSKGVGGSTSTTKNPPTSVEYGRENLGQANLGTVTSC